MINRILINREECEVRVAFMEKQTLVELHTEKFDEQSIVNNIYRGRVQDVVPGLQAAFVDVGLERNMFLHFMDIRPESLVLNSKDSKEAMRQAATKGTPGRIERRGRRPKPDPNSNQPAPVKRGDDIIVQVVKDEIGGKAPRVTTNLALAGRYLVMLPFPSQEGGVSRKIATGPERTRLKKLLAQLKNPDHSFIVRTVGVDQVNDPVLKDGQSLERLWDSILDKYRSLNGPGLIHNDHDLIARLVRDAFPTEFEEVICDDPIDAEQVRRQLEDHMPEAADRVKTYEGIDNIHAAFDVEKQVEKAMAHKIWLKSGGYLIIDENEALTAIDVNTGRFTGKRDQEKTSLKTNMEACEVVANIVRMRDIGGIIVIDFIDMLNRGHQEQVSEELRKHLRRDRAKIAIGKIGDFGLMMLTRKRQRLSLHKLMHDECPYCQGSGYILKPDEVFRKIKYDIKRLVTDDSTVSAVMVCAHPRMIELLRIRYRNFISQLKEFHGCDLVLREDPVFHLEDYQITPLKKPETEPVRLPESRLSEAERIQETAEFPGDAVEEVAEIPLKDYEEIPPAKPDEEEKPEPVKSAPASEARPAESPSEESDDSESSRAKRRRRRESSSERRARRRRTRHRDPESEEKEAQAEAPEQAKEPAPEKQEEQAGTTHEAEEKAQEKRRRTRRGSRGGQTRRRREAEEAQTAEEKTSEPAATSPAEPEKTGESKPSSEPAPTPPAQQEPKAPAEPLRLKLPTKRKQEDDLLADVLSEIGSEVESLRTNTGAKTSEAKKSEPEEQAKEAEKSAPADEKEEAKAAGKRPRKTSTTRKKSTASTTKKKSSTASKSTTRKSAKAAESTEQEASAEAPASEEKTGTKKKTTRKTKATGTAASGTTKSPGTKRKTTRQKKDEKEPAEGSQASKTDEQSAQAPAASEDEKSTGKKKTTRTRRTAKTTTKKSPKTKSGEGNKGEE